MTPAGRRAWAAAAFALAAAFASWNPLAAPFGLVVGLVSLVLCLRALVQGGARRVASAGLVLAALAVAVSGLVLALTAGVGRDPAGDPVVPGPGADEVRRALDAAGEPTRPARERAREELDAAGGGAKAPPDEPGGKPARR
ncbi:hypothetical protein ACOQFB_20235 [Anaeromyxobacter sp. Red801]|uniref:hypothetical protein n=1 Tax=Anaeromyxobacter sp. Red801 TaxID=3411632 RepID=UPI003B9FDAE0